MPSATQWEPREAAAKLIRPVLEELIRQAAQGSVMHNDDTGMRILRLAREPDDKRTGTFTSGVVSVVGAWTIALFFTGWNDVRENTNLDTLLLSLDTPRHKSVMGREMESYRTAVSGRTLGTIILHRPFLNGGTAPVGDGRSRNRSLSISTQAS